MVCPNPLVEGPDCGRFLIGQRSLETVNEKHFRSCWFAVHTDQKSWRRTSNSEHCSRDSPHVREIGSLGIIFFIVTLAIHSTLTMYTWLLLCTVPGRFPGPLVIVEMLPGRLCEQFPLMGLKKFLSLRQFIVIHPA